VGVAVVEAWQYKLSFTVQHPRFRSDQSSYFVISSHRQYPVTPDGYRLMADGRLPAGPDGGVEDDEAGLYHGKTSR
jgi:hypothetical protein